MSSSLGLFAAARLHTTFALHPPISTLAHSTAPSHPLVTPGSLYHRAPCTQHYFLRVWSGKTWALNVIPTEAEAGFDVRICPTMATSTFKAMLDEWCAEEGLEWK